jgi:tRNA pseudouridine55 synthase
VVFRVKKIVKCKKIGHCGTLDPLATGVLPILIGKATKILQFLPNTKKTYIASFKLGVTTDTQDITGSILTKSKVLINTMTCKNSLGEFIKESFQIPPMYSSIKKNGQPLYKLARSGIEVYRAARPIFVDEINLLEFNEKKGTGRFFVTCSSGTYVRTICHDLGQKLGCGAVMTDLIRTDSCGFSIKNSVDLEKIKESGREIGKILIKLDFPFRVYHKIIITKSQAFRFKCGGDLLVNRIDFKNGIESGQIFRVYDCDENFIGLGKISKQKQELAVLKAF